jgi:hypothetical protein
VPENTVPSGVRPDDVPIAPDGQRIVDQRAAAEERDEIAYQAERQTRLAAAERETEPSTRFWSSRRTQVGPLLALLAGVFTLAVRTWPIATPQGHGTVGMTWFLSATVVGVAYIVGFFLADRHWQRARLVLVCAAIVHLLIGGLASLIVGDQQVAPATATVLYDAVPAILALVAAALITSPPAPNDRR